MNDWIEEAKILLKKSLSPIPHELNELDWKSDISDKSDRIAQHISAFANNINGGYLIFGLNNDASFCSLNKDKTDEIIKKIGNIARNNITPPIAIEHNITTFDSNEILIIKIPEATNKPVYLRGKTIDDSYKRSAGQTVKMSKQEIKNLLSIAIGIDFEMQTAMLGISDDEVLKHLNYDSYFSLQERRLPDTKTGILQVLANDDLIKLHSQTYDILNLGAILFCRDISYFRELKRKAARVILYKGTSRINGVKEYENTEGYASSFEGFVKYISDQLPSNEIIDDALRKKVKIYPEVAIREFVANALIHQDFSISGAGVMIEIFDDRIEITNPGVPLVDVNRFIDTAPKSRNEKLASLMRRLNICEERGSGIDRAISAIELYQLPAPKFIRGDDYTRVIMYAPVSLTKMNIEDRVRACYQHTCLNYINNQPVNNQSVRNRFKIAKNNISSASKIITETLERGLIKPSSPESASKKYASYIPFWA